MTSECLPGRPPGKVDLRDVYGGEDGTRESRHSGPVFPLLRYGPAGSSTMARNADRAAL